MASDQLQSQLMSEGENSLTFTNLDGITLNNIVRVRGCGKSLIAKQYPPFVKYLGDSHILEADRMMFEKSSLEDMNSLVPGCVPLIFACDVDKHIVLMEDFNSHSVLRGEIIASRVDKVAIQRLAEYLGNIHSATHVSNLSEENFQSMVSRYSGNSLVELTRRLMFVSSFDASDDSNIVLPEVQDFAEKRIYHQPQILTEVENLMNIFMHQRECLLHGDMHTGSIMVHNCTAKIVGSEFSCIGPPSFDLGVLIANYIIAYFSHMLTPEDNDSHRLIAYKMVDACKITGENYFVKFQPNVPNRSEYIANMVSATAGFCAVELLRRTLGVIHADDTLNRGPVELEIADCGLRLLQSYHRIHDVDRLLVIGLMLT